MLEKISNIHTKDNYSGGKKTSSYDKFFGKSLIDKNADKDSISFSPAAQMLTKVNWRLQEIRYQNKEKIILDFSISEFRLKTEVNLVFEIIKENKSFGSSEYFFVKMAVNKVDTVLPDELIQPSLNGLRRLFNKIIEVNIGSVTRDNDGVSLNYLLEDNEIPLIEDFKNIMEAIYTLIEKLGDFTLVKDYQFEEDGSPEVIIEKITRRTPVV